MSIKNKFSGLNRLLEYLQRRLWGDQSEWMDRKLLICFVMVLFTGWVFVLSASVNLADKFYHFSLYFALRQGIYLVMGLMLTLIFWMIPQEKIANKGGYALGVAIALLLLVLMIGKEVNGSIRWLSLGFFHVQVSEIAKLFLILYVASYLQRRQSEVRSGWWGFIKPLLVLLVVSGLLFAEPDFGAAVVLVCTVIGMIFLSGAKMKQYVVLCLITLIGVAIIAVSERYRIQRLTTYMNPWAYQFGSGYQLTQALIAFGRGGWFGIGLGDSIQKLFYLPEAHTDFIFAIMAEEIGFVGVVLVFLFLIYIASKAFSIGRYAEERACFFSAYLAYGIGLLFFTQICINIGVNTGLLPTKGLALPFISYGGSNLLMTCCAMGLLFRIDYENRAFHLTKAHEHAP